MKRFLALGIFGVFLFFSLTIWAQVPQLLNYQGRLTDDKGIPIITTTTVMFSLHQGGDATIEGSGTLVYQEDASVTPDDNGVFSHLIGSGTVIFGALDATVFQTADPVYLEITIDPEGANETLLPRKQIVTVGYSFKSELADDADTVDGQDASAFAPVVHHHDPDYVNEGQADSVTSAMIVDDTIVDADISAGANIAGSKIDPTGLDADFLDGKHSLAFVHTAGDDMTGTLNVDTSAQYALYGTSSSSSGKGVYGYVSATEGINYGVYGKTDSPEGTGVYGIAPTHGVYAVASATSGITNGVYGRSDSSSGYGVRGYAPTYGVYGEATATSGTNYAVYGETLSPEGYAVYGTGPKHGVYGEATATSGTNYAVYGLTISPEGYAVYGTAPRNGVYGEATATSYLNYGVYGLSNSTGGYGVYGYAAATSGATYGVYGKSNSTSGRGVYGYASANSGVTYGVYGISASSSGYGVYGKNTAGGYGGYFVGKVHISGNLTVEGSKPCVQPIDNGKKVLLYAMESPEIWFEDFGTAQLVNGQAVVQLESVFLQTANTGIDYLVFLTPRGACQGLYISRQDKDAFEVRELGSGTSSISFNYRIVAKRRGYEEVRFEEFTEPEQPPAEPNLPIAPKEANLKQPQRP